MNKIIKINYIEVSNIIFINTSNINFFKLIKNGDFYDFYIDDDIEFNFIDKEKKEQIEYFLQYGESKMTGVKYETIVLNVVNERIKGVSFTGIISK